MHGCEFIPSDDAPNLEKSLKRRGIRQVWHLTRVGQLPSIFNTGALLSRNQLDGLGISYGMSGWGNDEKAQELIDYICCSIVFPWGMSRLEPETKALISLDPQVLLRKGVLFCGTWSSFNEVTLANLTSNCTAEAFDLMFESETSSFPAPIPGEFLVPHCVPINEFLSRILFYTEEVSEETQRFCNSIKLPSGVSVKEAFRFVCDKYCFRGNI